MNIRTNPAVDAQVERLFKSIGAVSRADVWRRGLDALDREVRQQEVRLLALAGATHESDGTGAKMPPMAEVVDETTRPYGGLGTDEDQVDDARRFKERHQTDRHRKRPGGSSVGLE